MEEKSPIKDHNVRSIYVIIQNTDLDVWGTRKHNRAGQGQVHGYLVNRISDRFFILSSEVSV